MAEAIATPAPYRARVLPPEEFDQLADYPIGPSIQGTGALVVVVERDGVIVATWGAFTTFHLDGCWIDPAHRHTAPVVRALVTEMFDALQTIGVAQVLTITETEAVGTLARKIGGVVHPGTLWLIPVPAPVETP